MIKCINQMGIPALIWTVGSSFTKLVMIMIFPLKMRCTGDFEIELYWYHIYTRKYLKLFSLCDILRNVELCILRWISISLEWINAILTTLIGLQLNFYRKKLKWINKKHVFAVAYNKVAIFFHFHLFIHSFIEWVTRKYFTRLAITYWCHVKCPKMECHKPHHQEEAHSKIFKWKLTNGLILAHMLHSLNCWSSK